MVGISKFGGGWFEDNQSAAVGLLDAFFGGDIESVAENQFSKQVNWQEQANCQKFLCQMISRQSLHLQRTQRSMNKCGSVLQQGQHREGQMFGQWSSKAFLPHQRYCQFVNVMLQWWWTFTSTETIRLEVSSLVETLATL